MGKTSLKEMKVPINSNNILDNNTDRLKKIGVLSIDDATLLYKNLSEKIQKKNEDRLNENLISDLSVIKPVLFDYDLSDISNSHAPTFYNVSRGKIINSKIDSSVIMEFIDDAFIQDKNGFLKIRRNGNQFKGMPGGRVDEFLESFLNKTTALLESGNNFTEDTVKKIFSIIDNIYLVNFTDLKDREDIYVTNLYKLRETTLGIGKFGLASFYGGDGRIFDINFLLSRDDIGSSDIVFSEYVNNEDSVGNSIQRSYYNNIAFTFIYESFKKDLVLSENYALKKLNQKIGSIISKYVLYKDNEHTPVEKDSNENSKKFEKFLNDVTELYSVCMSDVSDTSLFNFTGELFIGSSYLGKTGRDISSYILSKVFDEHKDRIRYEDLLVSNHTSELDHFTRNISDKKIEEILNNSNNIELNDRLIFNIFYRGGASKILRSDKTFDILLKTNYGNIDSIVDGDYILFNTGGVGRSEKEILEDIYILRKDQSHHSCINDFESSAFKVLNNNGYKSIQEMKTTGNDFNVSYFSKNTLDLITSSLNNSINKDDGLKEYVTDIFIQSLKTEKGYEYHNIMNYLRDVVKFDDGKNDDTRNKFLRAVEINKDTLSVILYDLLKNGSPQDILSVIKSPFVDTDSKAGSDFSDRGSRIFLDYLKEYIKSQDEFIDSFAPYIENRLRIGKEELMTTFSGEIGFGIPVYGLGRRLITKERQQEVQSVYGYVLTRSSINRFGTVSEPHEIINSFNEKDKKEYDDIREFIESSNKVLSKKLESLSEIAEKCEILIKSPKKNTFSDKELDTIITYVREGKYSVATFLMNSNISSINSIISSERGDEFRESFVDAINNISDGRLSSLIKDMVKDTSNLVASNFFMFFKDARFEGSNLILGNTKKQITNKKFLKSIYENGYIGSNNKNFKIQNFFDFKNTTAMHSIFNFNNYLSFKSNFSGINPIFDFLSTDHHNNGPTGNYNISIVGTIEQKWRISREQILSYIDSLPSIGMLNNSGPIERISRNIKHSISDEGKMIYVELFEHIINRYIETGEINKGFGGSTFSKMLSAIADMNYGYVIDGVKNFPEDSYINVGGDKVLKTVYKSVNHLIDSLQDDKNFGNVLRFYESGTFNSRPKDDIHKKYFKKLEDELMKRCENVLLLNRTIGGVSKDNIVDNNFIVDYKSTTRMKDYVIYNFVANGQSINNHNPSIIWNNISRIDELSRYDILDTAISMMFKKGELGKIDNIPKYIKDTPEFNRALAENTVKFGFPIFKISDHLIKDAISKGDDKEFLNIMSRNFNNLYKANGKSEVQSISDALEYSIVNHTNIFNDYIRSAIISEIISLGMFGEDTLFRLQPEASDKIKNDTYAASTKINKILRLLSEGLLNIEVYGDDYNYGIERYNKYVSELKTFNRENPYIDDTFIGWYGDGNSLSNLFDYYIDIQRMKELHTIDNKLFNIIFNALSHSIDKEDVVISGYGRSGNVKFTEKGTVEKFPIVIVQSKNVTESDKKLNIGIIHGSCGLYSIKTSTKKDDMINKLSISSIQKLLLSDRLREIE